MGIKEIIKLSVLLSGATYSLAGHSATVQLDFTTYTQYKHVCSNSGCTSYDYFDNPIISNYQFVLDMTNSTNSAYTDAYNGSATYTESITTNLWNSSGDYPEYSSTNGSVGQTYSQAESVSSGGAVNIVSDMTNSVYMSDYSQAILTSDLEYTGNLPPELAPEAGASQALESAHTGFDWTSFIGTTPNFIVYDEARIVALFNSLIGEQFNYYGYVSSQHCLGDIDMYGHCSEGWSGNTEVSNGGYAILTATTVVPVPAAVWLFGSGLLGLIGIARRKRT